MPDTTVKRVDSHVPRLRQALFDFLFYDSPCGIGICDQNLRIVEVNPAWAVMDGKPVADHVGRTVPEVLGVDACPVEEAMREVLRTGKARYKIKFAARIPARQTPIHWTVNLVPIRNASGEITHVGSFTLITVPKEPYLIPIEDNLAHNDMIRGFKKLAPREAQVAKLLAEGKSNKEIGTALSISEHTVETYRKRIMKTLGIHSTASLVSVVIRAGLRSSQE